jgi:peptide/nickel transport system permease protein
LENILRMLLHRFALGVVILIVISIIIFLGVSMLPGDAAEAILGQAATPDTVAALRRQLGLDLPAHTRYLHWLSNMLQGDFGISIGNGRDIAELVGVRFTNTIFLASLAACISMPLALLLGILAALYRNTLYDRIVNVVTLSSISTPEFFVSYILILFVSVKAGLLPSLSNIQDGISFGERIEKTILPALALTLVSVAYVMRMTRAAIINLMASSYIEMATLKGIRKSRIVTHHALPNAWAPIVNVIVLNLAYLVVGVVVVEVVFVYPGLGQLLVDAVRRRDMPVVQACCLIFAATYVFLNMTADILSILTNPRMLHPK